MCTFMLDIDNLLETSEKNRKMEEIIVSLKIVYNLHYLAGCAAKYYICLSKNKCYN